jgi:hypothetical protein
MMVNMTRRGQASAAKIDGNGALIVRIVVENAHIVLPPEEREFASAYTLSPTDSKMNPMVKPEVGSSRRFQVLLVESNLQDRPSVSSLHYFFNPAAQLRTTVIDDPAPSSTGTMIRNRPSGATSYWLR